MMQRTTLNVKKLHQTLALAYDDTLTAKKRWQLAKSYNQVPAIHLESLLPETRQRVDHWMHVSLKWLSKNPQNTILTWWDPDYPSALRNLSTPPLILYTTGQIKLMNHACLAMVGSRGATSVGLRRAVHFASELSKQGWVIVSGLAQGIDAASHWGCVKNNGATIAVMGCGIDVIYPSENEALYQQIVKNGGLLISEYPPQTPPRPIFFPRRNRIIAGLCDGLLVIEATMRSGSLITARLANEMGKPIMAIPGSIDSPQARGCHHMIKNGAVLIETVQDIEQECNSTLDKPRLKLPSPSEIEKPIPSKKPLKSQEKPEKLKSHLLKILTAESMSFDDLLIQVQLTFFKNKTVNTNYLTTVVLAELFELQTEKHIKNFHGQIWQIV